MLKLKNIKIDNFAKFNNFELHFDNKITKLIGINGSGKTTIGLTAIWAVFKGLAERGDSVVPAERFRFIGSQKASADIQLTLMDTNYPDAEITVKNHITKQGNDISFESTNYPEKLDDDWFKRLLNVAFISAKNFCQVTSKQQALLLGIDISEYNVNVTNLKAEYTQINSQLKKMGTLIEPEKVENLIDLVELETFNKLQQKKKIEIAAKESQITNLKLKKQMAIDTITKLEAQISEQKIIVEEILNTINLENKKLNEMEKPLEEKSLIPVQEHNRKYYQYKEYQTNASKKIALETELIENKNKQKQVEIDKINYIKNFKFGFSNLTVNDDGELLLNDRPIREPYFSRGELEVIVSKLYISQNPKLKVRFIDDLEVLDTKNQELIIDELLKNDFQIITAEVGEIGKDDNYIVLKECKIQKPEQGILL